MNLFIIGVNHNNPNHRSRLYDTYTSIYKSRLAQPSFLAIEYDENHAKTILGQRGYFNQLCRNEWPQLSAQVFKILTESLVYEADTHIDIFPSVKIIWLDDGRNAPEDVITKYAYDRLNIYKSLLKSLDKPVSDENILINLDTYSKRIGGSFTSTGRDVSFARIIIDVAVSNIDYDYGIAVVGVNHASGNSDSMRSIIENSGIKCTVLIL